MAVQDNKFGWMCHRDDKTTTIGRSDGHSEYEKNPIRGEHKAISALPCSGFFHAPHPPTKKKKIIG